MNPSDEIIIEGLRIDGVIGVYEFERTHVQPMVFDLALSVAIDVAAASDELPDTIDYAAVVSALREFVVGRHDQLLEKLARECCDFLAHRFRASRVRLRVVKPQAAQALGCAAVGVQLQRVY